MRPIARNVTGFEMQRLGPLLPHGFSGDARAALDRVGPLLHRLLVLMDRQRDLVDILWKRYLAECRRRRVEPRSSVEDLAGRNEGTA